MKYKVFSQGLLQTNCTVLEKDGKCVVVDVPFGATDLENYVAGKLQVVAVLLTHGHFDHCGGVAHFLRRCNCPNAPVYVHERDMELCRHAQENIWGAPCENCYPTSKVSQGKLILDGFEFDVLETPGHTGGSVAYVAENVLLAGDTLFKNGVGRTDFAESCPSELPVSLRKLCKIASKTVICGHGEPTTLQDEKQNNPYLHKYCEDLL